MLNKSIIAIAHNNAELSQLLGVWESKLMSLNVEVLTHYRNSQNRSIKEIVGHMVDSASNNTHRCIQLQYRTSPVYFHNYASHGNNDKWIAIQQYQSENWNNLLALWKNVHLHFIHVAGNINEAKLTQIWDDGENSATLEDMVLDFLRHFKLHLAEIDELIQKAYEP